MIRSSSDLSDLSPYLVNASCAFGVFDGVHLGHRFIINRALEQAKENDAPSVILTFDVDPDEFFAARTLHKLMPNKERIQALDTLGATNVVVLPFTREFAALSPEHFLEALFTAGAPDSLHIGYDFRFGCKGSGTVADLRAWGSSVGCEIDSVDLYSLKSRPVTATTIRAFLQDCKIKEANEFLGRRYALSGVVENGRGEGRDMGFRTANLQIPTQLFALGAGVYAAYAYTESGDCYKAAVSVGASPTFGERVHQNIEAHLIDFSSDIYGQTLRLEFVEYLRPMVQFDSIEELISAVMGNIEWCRANL